jgi:hypothetical protein
MKALFDIKKCGGQKNSIYLITTIPKLKAQVQLRKAAGDIAE